MKQNKPVLKLYVKIQFNRAHVSSTRLGGCVAYMVNTEIKLLTSGNVLF